MELLKNFGFEPSLFFAQIVNFLILAYIFKRFLYKPLLTVLKQRQEKIVKGIEDSEKAALLKEESQKERSEILKQTRAEADEIIKTAKNIAEQARQEILKNSQTEGQKIIQEGKLQASLQIQKMEKKMKEISLDLAYDMISKVIQSLFTEEEKQLILRRTIQKLEKKDLS